ncbi:MAG: serine hydrolase [Chloroflexota bacterium]
MLKVLRRILLIAIVLVGGTYLLYQGFLFWRAMDKFPPGTTVANVLVEGLTYDQAKNLLLETYMSPITIYNGDERATELLPADVGFSIDADAMLEQARTEWQAQEMWRRYLEFVVGIAPYPIEVPIRAAHNEDSLRGTLDTVANYVDKPARVPVLLTETGEIQPGEPGVIVDRDQSLTNLRMALYDTENRVANLALIDEPAPEWDISVLDESIRNILSGFDGFSSVFIVDLQTGEEVAINADVAVSALSILKIAIFIEAYRALDNPPDAFQEDLFVSTATASSNHSANLLLHIIAGEDNTYEGAAVLTQEMHDLGLANTFMAIPYDAATVPTRPSTYETPANQRTDIDTSPDPSMQTTAEDIGTLLEMLYYCAEGEGGFLAIYPDELTQSECQAIVDLMVGNVEGNLIRYGVPEESDVRVSHKHGWSINEHGDAGIVYSPGGDYVIYTLLAQPDSDWLSSEYSFPILREISRAAYNYFNPDHPYAGREDIPAENDAVLLGGT